MNVHRAYSMAMMITALHGQMREMLTQGILPWLAQRKILEQYRWIVKFDCMVPICYKLVVDCVLHQQELQMSNKALLQGSNRRRQCTQLAL